MMEIALVLAQYGGSRRRKPWVRTIVVKSALRGMMPGQQYFTGPAGLEGDERRSATVRRTVLDLGHSAMPSIHSVGMPCKHVYPGNVSPTALRLVLAVISPGARPVGYG